MNKLALIAAFALISLPVSAQANDHAAPAAAAPVAVETTTTTTTTMAAPVVEMKEVTLKDGTKVVIEGDAVSVVAADGTKTAAPDGEHELADGTKVTTKDGKLVPAVMEAPKMEAPKMDAPAAK